MRKLIQVRFLGSVLVLGLFLGVALINDLFTQTQICNIASTSSTVSMTIEGKNIASFCTQFIRTYQHPELGLYLYNGMLPDTSIVCSVKVDNVLFTIRDANSNGFEGGYMCRWLNSYGNGTPLPSAPMPITVQYPTTVPLLTQPLTLIKATATQTPNCFHWYEITPSMAGRRLCVYGTVSNVYDSSVSSTRI